ncbi:hypothetical protein T11_18262 [Trichinella zimbabwensis]|uniref:Peptidase aspartic putative domain-containing protein n=1 Tax=Trichinella zimbabwensis TaxID=268475 RepID=A0A0V1HX34_9BILA|nr:hypothetical protein T11_18262 [Trichinella zimbabwensis]
MKADEKLRSDLTAFQCFIREQTEAMTESHGAGRNGNPGKSSNSSSTNSMNCKNSFPVRNRRTATFLHASVSDRCPICKGSHKASACSEVLKLPRAGTLGEMIGQRGGRKNSGRSGDSVTLLSSGKPSDPPHERDQKEGGQPRPIIWALAHSDGGEKMVVNCLFDTAAERSFIRADVAHELSLRGETLLIAVRGFSGGCREAQKSQLVRALTMEKLCDSIVQSEILIQAWPHLRRLGLPDEEGEEDLPVHVILGVDYFLRMLGSTIVRRGDDDPVAVETCLRWVVCVPQPPPPPQTPAVPADKSADLDCDQIMWNFWELEVIGIHSEPEKAQSSRAREEFEQSLSYDGV